MDGIWGLIGIGAVVGALASWVLSEITRRSINRREDRLRFIDRRVEAASAYAAACGTCWEAVAARKRSASLLDQNELELNALNLHGQNPLRPDEVESERRVLAEQYRGSKDLASSASQAQTQAYATVALVLDERAVRSAQDIADHLGRLSAVEVGQWVSHERAAYTKFLALQWTFINEVRGSLELDAVTLDALTPATPKFGTR